MDGQHHEPPLQGSAAQGRELVYWIAKAAERLRKENDISLALVAGVAGVNQETVKRFEKVERFPAELDVLMVAYAHLAGLDDERDIYHDALEMWARSHPSALERISADDGPMQRAMQHLARPSQKVAAEVEKTAARQARQRAAGERGRKSTSTQKRQAAR